jgi:hypothetical protein
MKEIDMNRWLSNTGGTLTCSSRFQASSAARYFADLNLPLPFCLATVNDDSGT